MSPSSDCTLHKSPETPEKVQDQERQPQHRHGCSTDRDLELPRGSCTPGVTQQLLFVFTASRAGGVRAAQNQQICQNPNRALENQTHLPAGSSSKPAPKPPSDYDTSVCVTRSASGTPRGTQRPAAGSEHRERPRRARGSSGHWGARRHDSPGGERDGTGAAGASFPPVSPRPRPFPVPPSALAARPAWISLLTPATASRGNSAPASRESGGAVGRKGGIMRAALRALP